MTPLEQKFQGGWSGGSNQKDNPWVGYGYFLESHNHSNGYFHKSSYKKWSQEPRNSNIL